MTSRRSSSGCGIVCWLFAVVMNFGSYWFSDKIVLRMYKAQEVGPEHPLHRMTARLAQQGLPSFDQFDPGPGVHDPKQLAVWKVEAGNPELVFRALYRGSLLDEAFNEGWAGKTLAEVTPPSLRSAITIWSKPAVRSSRIC